MSTNFNPYANYGYMALIKEATDTTPVTPTTYVKIISESLLPSFGIQTIAEIAGSREKNINSIQGNIEVDGDVALYAEDKISGHFLRSLLGAPTSQTVVADTSYRHRFEVQDDDRTYTFDINPADAPWVHRFYGVHSGKLLFNKEDNAIKMTTSLIATRAFLLARVLADVSSGTNLNVDQTGGLTTSDSILVLSKETGYTTLEEFTINAIVDENNITVGAAITATIEADDIVVLKRATVVDSDYTQCEPFQFQNGTQILTGDDIDNTTEISKEDFEIVLENDLQKIFGSGGDEIDRYPQVILVKGYSATGKVSRYYDNEMNLDNLRSNDDIGIRYLFKKHTAISANAAIKASSTWGDTVNGFKVEATTGAKAGNDYNITFVINSEDTLAASISGKNILVSLASTTASKNTGTLVAGVIDALTGVDGTAEGTGVETFTAAAANVNLGAKGTGTDVVGADASEKPYLQIDFSAANFEPFFPNNEQDAILIEDVPMKFFKDSDCADDQRKGWGTKIYLFNDVQSY